MRITGSILRRSAGWVLAGELGLGGAAMFGGCDEHHYGGGIHYDSYDGYVEPYHVRRIHVVPRRHGYVRRYSHGYPGGPHGRPGRGYHRYGH